MGIDIDRLGPAAQKQVREELERRRRAAAAKARQQKARDGPALFHGGSDRGSALEEEYYRAYIWPKELAGTVANVERHKKFELLPKSDYCGLRLPAAHYTPDFIVEYTNGTVEVIEVKHEAIRALQGSYVYRRRLFIEKYARPNGWIRHADSPETSFFTLQLDTATGEVLQNRGRMNCARTPEVEEFEKQWLCQVVRPWLAKKQKTITPNHAKTAAA